MPTSIVRSLARATSRVFYRIDCAGAPPRDGAVLLLPNHANALLDPVVIWATAGRDVRFLAKSTLFRGPLRPLLNGARAIPVYRKLDEGVDVSKNAETFSAVDRALAQGDAICIFPEGISHSTGRLVPLRTGAARMALGAERAGTRVSLVPVGLNFERKTAFRSRVTIVYGAAFSCEDLSSSAGAQPDTVRALTDRISGRMRRLLVEADPKADAALVERVDRVYAAARRQRGDAAERVARQRVIASGIERLRAADPARYEEILLRLRRYDDRMARFGFRDRHLEMQVTASDAARFAVRESLAALALLPLAAAAVIAFAVPYHITGRAARLFAREADVEATAKVAAGAVIYAAWLALLGVITWRIGSPRTALLVVTVLPALAIAGLFAIERESAVFDAMRTWFLLRRTGSRTRARLVRRRSELADVLDEVSRWLEAEVTTQSVELKGEQS